MREIVLLKQGEMVLKGANRYKFEARLIRNVKAAIETLAEADVYAKQSTVFVEFKDENVDMDEAEDRLSRVFGAVSITRAAVCDYDFDEMAKSAVEYLRPVLSSAKNFKVIGKRADKRYPMKSPQIGAELGAKILEAFPHLDVKMEDPEVTVYAEVREGHIYVHPNPKKGAGGLPCSSSGHGLLMLSGGLDSPVAGYMMARRGMRLSAIHFESPPYTSERALLKVEKLAKLVSRYSGKIDLYTVHFTEIQEQIRQNCDEDFFTLIMRRFMMRIACKIAEKCRAGALITGESLGQVASQTLEAIRSTDDVATMSVFRPCIGMDKQDIVDISFKIGTYETSIEPFEDCCTVFTPRHPKTKPSIEEVRREEAKLDIEGLLDKVTYERKEMIF